MHNIDSWWMIGIGIWHGSYDACWPTHDWTCWWLTGDSSPRYWPWHPSFRKRIRKRALAMQMHWRWGLELSWRSNLTTSKAGNWFVQHGGYMGASSPGWHLFINIILWPLNGWFHGMLNNGFSQLNPFFGTNGRTLRFWTDFDRSSDQSRRWLGVVGMCFVNVCDVLR